MTPVASPIIDTATGTGGFNGCTVGVTLTPSGSAALATGGVTLALNVPITNGPTGATQVTVGATAIGTVVKAAGTSSIPLSYNFGADAAYGYYVSVTVPSTASDHEQHRVHVWPVHQRQLQRGTRERRR